MSKILPGATKKANLFEGFGLGFGRILRRIFLAESGRHFFMLHSSGKFQLSAQTLGPNVFKTPNFSSVSETQAILLVFKEFSSQRFGRFLG